MPYIVQFTDHPSTTPDKKAVVRPSHIEYIMSNAHRIIASGGFFPEDGDFPNGGLIILDVETKAEAIDYIENDPFYLKGLFREYTITRWKKFIFDYKRV